MDNFPVGHIPATVPVSSLDFARAFQELDDLRPMLLSEDARAALTRIELLVERMAGV